MTQPDITPLRILENGQLVLTIHAVALILGTHPDDIAPNIVNAELPEKLRQQAFQRQQEALAHGTNPDTISIITYWAQKEPDTQVHTDPLGQTWMTTTPPPATGRPVTGC